MTQDLSSKTSDLPPSPCTRGEGPPGISLQRSVIENKDPLPRPLPEYEEREAATWIAATLLFAGGPMLGLMASGHFSWMHAFVAATLVSICSAAASMFVIRFGLRDSHLLPSAAMGATLIRATISLGGGVIAVTMFDLAAPPVLLMILAYYLAVLVAECAILFRAFQPRKEL